MKNKLGRGSGKLRAAFSVGLPPFVGGFPPHPPSCLRIRTARYNYPYKLGTSLNNNNNNKQQDAKFQRRPSSLINSKNTLALTSTKLG